MVMPKSGKFYTCVICGKEFYRQPNRIKYCKDGIPKCCSRPCQNKYQVGENNPFWNRTHSKETKAKVSKSRKGKGLKNQNATGYKHSEESKKKISKASKRLWVEQKDMMLATRVRGEAHIYHKKPEERRHRKQFTVRQRREWKGSECFFCGSTENLELDHIVPIFDGGKNHQDNAQTLCRGCNLWKTKYVDLPRHNAFLALQGGRCN